MNILNRKFSRLSLSLIAVIIIAGCASTVPPAPAPTPSASVNAMGGGTGMDMKAPATVPAGKAYAEGQEIYFMHTEVSDEGVAKILTNMMNSPVLIVPSLAKATDDMLANVYVFKNGLKGMGPLGFQPDVFDNPPGTDGYRPLRRLVLVTWQDEKGARELKSLAEVKAALDKGELTAEQPGVVINMPFVTWPGGKR